MRNFITVLQLLQIFGNCARFPDDFKFGVATSAYQIEGGWDADGKGENIWDRLTHTHQNWTNDHANADVACDSYRLWNNDVEMLKYLEVNFYRFSLSWSRILPSGYSNYINPDGVRYYNNIINELLKYSIEPVVTMYHWDLPQPLQEIGGWPNPLLAQYFEDYAKVVFESFGDRVKTWITFNEPQEICVSGYSDGTKAPLQNSSGIGDYLCGKTILLAHAKAYHAYDKYFRAKQKGKISIAINTHWMEPKTNSSNDIKAAERIRQMHFGWWTHPIYSKSGDYPRVMNDRITYLSKVENFSRSRLPELEVKYILGTSDFFALNHYSSWLVKEANAPVHGFVSRSKDISIGLQQCKKWKKSAVSWLRVVPRGLRKLLNWIKKEYNNPSVFITENGFADQGEMDDVGRIDYLTGYLNAILEAKLLDGCNVNAYTVWSLMDGLEWRDGYKIKYGLYHVNFTDPDRKRTAKESAEFYKHLIKKRVLPHYEDSHFTSTGHVFRLPNSTFFYKFVNLVLGFFSLSFYQTFLSNYACA